MDNIHNIITSTTEWFVFLIVPPKKYFVLHQIYLIFSNKNCHFFNF
jgi:hypothetical protein